MTKNKTALIGHTGFVGNNILKQKTFDFLYNSKNIGDIRGKEFELVVCAGVSSLKWYAKKHPEEDFFSIKKLMENLEKVNTKHLILISTVDVYPRTIKVNEDSIIDLNQHLPYGKHRRNLELFSMHNFDSTIIRLPGLFGEGLKKNIIYDLLNRKYDYLTNKKSTLQFYNLDNIWKDISKTLKNKIELINFGTEPVPITEIANECFEIDYKGDDSREPLMYDMQTKYGFLWGKDIPYLYSRSEVLKDLKSFAKRYIREK